MVVHPPTVTFFCCLSHVLCNKLAFELKELLRLCVSNSAGLVFGRVWFVSEIHRQHVLTDQEGCVCFCGRGRHSKNVEILCSVMSAGGVMMNPWRVWSIVEPERCMGGSNYCF